MPKCISCFAIFAVLFVSGCDPDATSNDAIRPNGHMQTIVMDLSDFKNIDASHSFSVELRQADSFQVVLDVDEVLVPYLDVTLSGDTLSLFLESGNSYDLEGECLRAVVYMPTVERITLSDASMVSGQMDVESLIVTMSDASTIELIGSASFLDLTESSASQALLSAFPVADCDATLSGSSNGLVHVSDSLLASLSGTSRLTYMGNPPDVDVSTSGSSETYPEN